MKTNNKSIMQNALGEQWDNLPEALKAHYRENSKGENFAEGWLDIDYPWFMQWPLSLLRLMGALINRRGKTLPSTASKTMKDNKQHWHRNIAFPNGKSMHFNSVFVSNGGNEIIEYTNAFLGLKMYVYVEDDKLRYESKGYVLKLGRFKVPIPEWMALGHASIIEQQYMKDDKQTFKMDFRLRHPLFGEIFCYKGVFKTKID